MDDEIPRIVYANQAGTAFEDLDQFVESDFFMDAYVSREEEMFKRLHAASLIKKSPFDITNFELLKQNPQFGQTNRMAADHAMIRACFGLGAWLVRNETECLGILQATKNEERSGQLISQLLVYS